MMKIEDLCIHSITTKPWSLETAAKKYAAAGVAGISVWRDAAQAFSGNFKAAGEMLRNEGVEIVCYVRGGFFTAFDAADRARAVDDNKRIVSNDFVSR